MSNLKIIGQSLPNIPWQDKPENFDGVIWRHDTNPVIDWNPTKNTARIFNSAVVPYGDGFIGIFRADHRNGKPQLHLGHSKDALSWDIEDEEIHWIDEYGKAYKPNYSYDPRLVEIEGTYYIIWCTDFGGSALCIGSTMNFKNFVRLENPFIPFNRNGVLFPKKLRVIL